MFHLESCLSTRNSQFSLSGTNLIFTSGSIAYRASIDSPATTSTIVDEGGPLSLSGTFGTVAQGGLVYEALKVPIAASFDFGNDQAMISLTLSGEINAKYLIPSSNGDCNQSGTVDAADYVAWRRSLGESGIGLAADANGDNQITTADFDVWR